MTNMKHRTLNGLVLMVAATAVVGCAGNRIGQERDALMTENKELRTALQQTRNNRVATETDRDRLVAEVNRLQQELNTRPTVAKSNTGFDAISGVEVEHASGVIKVKVPGDVLFASGQTILRQVAKRTLDQIVSVLKTQYAPNTIGVEGHTDTDPIRKSKWKGNLELSLHRAAAVYRYLQSKGVDATRMYAGGWGQTQPRSTKAKSRRVEILILTE